jgi:nucleotide-binding universal stress UspA family protein
MRTIKRILVPMDFEPDFRTALDHAVALARRSDADIVILHAFDVPVVLSPGAPLMPMVDVTADLETSGQQWLDGVVDEARRAYPRVTGRLCRGLPSHEILAVAADENADLIVMETHGRTGMAHAFLGSVAEKVVRTSPIPVMTVHAAP